MKKIIITALMCMSLSAFGFIDGVGGAGGGGGDIVTSSSVGGAGGGGGK